MNEEMKKLYDAMMLSKSEGNGYVWIPTIKGFDVYEVNETILRLFLMENKKMKPKQSIQ